METLVLARLDAAAMTALGFGALFVLIMGYLLFGGGSGEPDPEPPARKKPGARQPKTRR